MSASKKLTLRVQSPEGTARVEVSGGGGSAAVYAAVQEALRLPPGAFTLYRDQQRRSELIAPPAAAAAAESGLRHGDMIYLSPLNGAVLFEQPSTSTSSDAINKKPFGELDEAGPSTTSVDHNEYPARNNSNKPEEDEVDLILYKQSGKIQRQRDEKLCRHNSMGCCVHCSPLEPWDEEYLKEHNIKHMSFHAYLRKKITSGKFISLDELSIKIKPGCSEHPAWPRGICSKCQPGAVTLSRQTHRHVDNVEIEHPALVERFLSYWRATGHQRLGLLYGRHEPHPTVPLGIRARVCAIYEPAQESSRDHVTLAAEDSRAAAAATLAAALGLRPVGWIFTDLLPDPQDPTLVQHLRGMESHFLSAQECIMAGHLQSQHPNPCRYASSGYFGSKFVTVCVTGDSSRRIHMEGYQVSGQCEALVRGGALLPTRDAPDLAYVRDSSPRLYVPDVYYKERDAYGNDVKVSAKRLPVAYLLVDVPVGSAGGGAAQAAAAGAGAGQAAGAGAGGSAGPLLSPRARFPPANRPLLAHLQTLKAFHQHMQENEDFLEAMSDLHVLVYLACNEQVGLGTEAAAELAAAVAARDTAAAAAWRDRTPAFDTLMALAEHAHQGGSETEGVGAPTTVGGGGGGVWTCPHCTFHNAPSRDHCDMCALPRDNAM